MVSKVNCIAQRLNLNLLPQHKSSFLFFSSFFIYKLLLHDGLGWFLNYYSLRLFNSYIGYSKNGFIFNLFLFRLDLFKLGSFLKEGTKKNNVALFKNFMFSLAVKRVNYLYSVVGLNVNSGFNKKNLLRFQLNRVKVLFFRRTVYSRVPFFSLFSSKRVHSLKLNTLKSIKLGSHFSAFSKKARLFIFWRFIQKFNKSSIVVYKHKRSRLLLKYSLLKPVKNLPFFSKLSFKSFFLLKLFCSGFFQPDILFFSFFKSRRSKTSVLFSASAYYSNFLLKYPDFYFLNTRKCSFFRLKRKFLSFFLEQVFQTFLKKEVRLNIFNCFSLFNRYNKFELLLNFFNVKNNYFRRGVLLDYFTNSKFIFYFKFVLLLLLSIKLKVFSHFSDFVCKEIGLLKRQWVDIRKIKTILGIMKIRTFNFLGLHIQIKGTIQGRLRTTRHHIFKFFNAPAADLNAEVYFIEKQSVSVHGVLGVKFWFYF